MRRSLSAWVILGVLFLASNESRGDDVVISTAPLLSDATAQQMVIEPYIQPIGSKKPKIVSGFGHREIPTALVANGVKAERHEGVDYSVPVGAVVRAAHSGKVIFAGFSKMYVSRSDKTDQHRFLIVRHEDGTSCRYVHLSGLKVKPGQEVKSGQALGLVSESSEWTVPVFHFETRDAQGQPVNPEKVIKS